MLDRSFLKHFAGSFAATRSMGSLCFGGVENAFALKNHLHDHMVMDFGGLGRNFYFRLFRDFEYSQTSQPMYCMYKARLLEYK